ncbi:MAG: hypothetical protein QOD07_1036 [Frankiaceae bacterium]|jgi:hypothetical protein|nr:hypothetical protein [Frankiaceae bacterium]
MERTMGIALSLLLVAAGAIMRFAVTVQGHGFNVHTTGLILMAVGAVGVLLSLVFWASWGGFSRRPAAVASTSAIVERERPVEREPDAQDTRR